MPLFNDCYTQLKICEYYGCEYEHHPEHPKLKRIHDLKNHYHYQDRRKKKLKCEDCLREYKSKSGLKHHKCRSLKTKPTLLYCQKCSNVYKTEGGIQRHMYHFHRQKTLLHSQVESEEWLSEREQIVEK